MATRTTFARKTLAAVASASLALALCPAVALAAETSDASAASASASSTATASAEAASSSAAANISTQAGDTDLVTTTNITWATQDHGTAELVSVTLSDKTVLDADDLAANTKTDDASFAGGVLSAPAGSTVTAKFLPERGYQLTSDTIASGTVTLNASPSDDTVGQYSFQMPSSDFTLDCDFEAQDDVVTSNSDAVSEGSLVDAESATDHGTLSLTVADMGTQADRDAIAAKANQASDVVAFLELALENVTYQGSSAQEWSTPITKTSTPVSLTLKLSDDVVAGADQFYVIREADNGEFQRASVTYNPNTQSITFRTDQFANYAIVKGSMSSGNTSSTSTSSSSTSSKMPSTGDDVEVLPFAAGLAAAVVFGGFALRRMRKPEER